MDWTVHKLYSTVLGQSLKHLSVMQHREAITNFFIPKCSGVKM